MPRYEVLVVLGRSTTCACVELMQHGAVAHMATVVVCIVHWWKYLAEDNEEEKDNYSMNELFE